MHFGKKILTLPNVYYVDDVRKNLVFVPLLNKYDQSKSVLEGDKFILSKGWVIIGKEYLCESIFKLNVINNNKSTFAYIVESCDLWHIGLGHVNFRKIKDMMNSSLMPKINRILNECTTYMLTKITRLPFKRVERSSKILDLIHSNVCDLHGWNIGGKWYFVTFIDDCTRYCCVYLMHSKDEILDKCKIFKSQVTWKFYRMPYEC